MKHILTLSFAALAGALLAAPGTPVVTSVTTDAEDGGVRLVYDLPGTEAAIVTLSVTADGVSREAVHAVGAVNRRVAAATTANEIFWQPRLDLPAGKYAPQGLTFTLKAWALASPPDYMAVSLLAPSCVRYYVSADAVPGGVQDARWKEDWMLFRRIPAKNVTWRAGCAANDYCWGSSELNANYGVQPLRYVTSAADFYLGVYEVTQGQYKRLANGANPSGIQKGSFSAAATHYAAHQTDWKWHPVERVTWTLADAAAASLASQSGLGFCLPSADDWEFAARGETQWGTYNGAPFTPAVIMPIGVNYQRQNAYYGGTQESGMHPEYACHMPVGLQLPNKYGLYDMVGNVTEWCSGWYDDAQTLHPLKGGNLHMSGEGFGVGYTRGSTGSSVSFQNGFRIACTIGD